jgi:lipid A 3-O-deacylase PagL
LTRTRALRATFSLAAPLVFLLEGECTLAQAQAAPDAPAAQPASGSLPFEEDLQTSSPFTPTSLDAHGGWNVFASYGQASAPRSQGFAEAATLSVAREFPLGSRFSLDVELTPLFVVNQTRVDLPGRPRGVAYAVAASPVVAWTFMPKTSRFGLRLEGAVGVFWGFSRIPPEGSRFNFLDELAGLVLFRAGNSRLVSAGLRRVHVSNLGLAGSDNPGLSFYSGVVGLSWPAEPYFGR